MRFALFLALSLPRRPATPPLRLPRSEIYPPHPACPPGPLSARFVPFVGVHFLTLQRCYWGLESSLTTHLNILLVKKFLNYTEDGRNQVAIEQLVMTIVRDVTASVCDGYIQVKCRAVDKHAARGESAASCCCCCCCC